MKRLLIIVYMLIGVLILEAQISVSSFRLLETDLTANTHGTIEHDQNGEVAALIKVVTTQTGFTFDGGSLGIVKTVQKPAEIWVYVPRGLKKITISHPQLGVLRDYYLPVSIASAKTYEMVLIAGEVQTIVKQARTSQYVVFQLTPPNAFVELDGEVLATNEGTATKLMKFGTYNYRVQAPNYLPEAGNVTINDPKNKHVVNVALKPNFSSVTLNVDGNAEIWVNGERKGTGSWTGNLGAGTYVFEAKKENHRDSYMSRDIIVTSEPQTITLQAPTPIQGEADINSSPAMADIYIDGKKVGQTPQMVSDLLVGQHQVRISKQGYNDFNSTLTVREGETSMLTAKLEKPKAEQNVTVSNPGMTSSAGNMVITVGNVSFTMVRVEGGTFQMGATGEQGSDADRDEKPVHKVTLSPYYIGETEVTQALWEAVMGSNPSNFKGNNRPVERVSWNDCQKFVQKLNQKTGREFRLPTEAEWEFAARGGNKSCGYKYSGSNNSEDVAWFGDNSSLQTHDVKTKQANELGLYDMSGNVWEWCQDWYAKKYPSSTQTNPVGSSSGYIRVNRGGSWSSETKLCRVSSRGFIAPDARYYFLGLRLALQ
jgi:formylglycine-generating enzyme required for sulfatase activity